MSLGVIEFELGDRAPRPTFDRIAAMPVKVVESALLVLIPLVRGFKSRLNLDFLPKLGPKFRDTLLTL